MIFTYIIVGLFKVVITLVSIILAPIDILITSSLPSLSTALSSVQSFLTLIGNNLGYAVSWTLLPSTALQIIVMYFSFALVFPLSLWLIKLIINWYAKLKP